jgi:hypothetical protein
MLTTRVAAAIAAVYGCGLRRLHAFGVSLAGLEAVADRIVSSDSLAWSEGERKRGTGQQNSIDAAERYRAKVRKIDGVDR